MSTKLLLKMLVRPVIPREHGAWAVLLVPLIIGAQAGGEVDWLVLSFTLSALAGFLSNLPVQTLLRAAFSSLRNEESLRGARVWATIYLLLAILFLLPVLIVGKRWFLVPLGAAGVGSFLLTFFLTRHQPKTIASDLAAVFGLTLTAPGAFYVASGHLGEDAFLLWLLNVLFFGSCVFYVHMRIRALAAKKDRWGWKDRLTYGGTNLVYHLAMIGILLLLASKNITSAVQLLAFAPMTITALWGTARLVSETNLRRVGFMLLTHSVAFMILFLLFFREAVHR
jgi:hypothetical protein